MFWENLCFFKLTSCQFRFGSRYFTSCDNCLCCEFSSDFGCRNFRLSCGFCCCFDSFCGGNYRCCLRCCFGDCCFFSCYCLCSKFRCFYCFRCCFSCCCRFKYNLPHSIRIVTNVSTKSSNSIIEKSVIVDISQKQIQKIF